MALRLTSRWQNPKALVPTVRGHSPSTTIGLTFPRIARSNVTSVSWATPANAAEVRVRPSFSGRDGAAASSTGSGARVSQGRPSHGCSGTRSRLRRSSAVIVRPRRPSGSSPWIARLPLPSLSRRQETELRLHLAAAIGGPASPASASQSCATSLVERVPAPVRRRQTASGMCQSFACFHSAIFMAGCVAAWSRSGWDRRRLMASVHYWARVVECRSEVLSPVTRSDRARPSAAPGGKVKVRRVDGGELGHHARQFDRRGGEGGS